LKVASSFTINTVVTGRYPFFTTAHFLPLNELLGDIMKFVLQFVVLSLVIFSAGASADSLWRISKDRWTPADERGFSEFVQKIGEAKCGTFDTCLKNPANPYRATDPAGVSFYSDCADLPYMFRAYYAWKNGLPFGYQSGMAAVNGGTDLRYSPNGNRVTDRTSILAKQPGRYPNAVSALSQISGVISSAMFRVDPRYDSAANQNDFYSVSISRDTLVPGTAIYDPNGHVAIVYKVEKDGRVFYMDAHPDNSLTRRSYGKQFVRTRPAAGAGFKRFRPARLVDYTKDQNGYLVGGRIVLPGNGSLAHFNMDQYFGTRPSSDFNWTKATFEFQNQKMDYYDYVRSALAVGNLRYNPIEEMNNMLSSICQDLKDREVAVNLAFEKGIASKEHPARLPNNIYGTDGEWEEYSTPSRDARLKTVIKEARDRAEEFVQLYKQGSPRLDYTGTDLKGDMLKTFYLVSGSCQLAYRKSNGEQQALSLRQMIERLWKLSFDPYHCIELRWGASGEELASCRDSDVKRKWYDGEQFMRNNIDRPYDARMDFDLYEIQSWKPGNGVKNPPNVDIEGFLKN